MKTQGKQLIFSKMNLDTHNSLLDQRDIVYLMNGNIEGNESMNTGAFVQNQLSNDLCVTLPTGYEFVGPGIQLNNFEYTVFSTNGALSEIGLVNTKDCSYTQIVSSECLAFNTDYPVRGVYKHLNKTNEREIYFIDSLNYNRSFNIDQALSGNYPKINTLDSCSDCGAETIDKLDCDALRLNKKLRPPCISLYSNKQGIFSTGTYQIGIAYSEDGLTMSDFYFSDVVKIQSSKNDIGFDIKLPCISNPFNNFIVVLITQTKEGSLIIYNYGEYSTNTNHITINNLNATVSDVNTVLSKKVIYDKSKHIVSNDETLLLGKHEVIEPFEYQLQANSIEVKWLERKVSSKNAHLFPSLLRDEVYELSIEWTDENGQERGVYHIPGRDKSSDYGINVNDILFGESDPIPEGIYTYESEICDQLPQQIWQVQNTATLITSFDTSCSECDLDIIVTKEGRMGYYECQDITYPSENRWGDLQCKKVRRHRMPSSDLTHIHDQGTCVETLITDTLIDNDGNPYEVTYTTKEFQTAPCVNILGIRLENIPIPTINGVAVNGWTYRLLFADRSGNKSILHKGLIYNMLKEVDGDTEIMYPNYPYNDLKPDPFLSIVQTNGSSDSTPNYIAAQEYYKKRFTYQSPDTSFRETQNEFGTELKLYTEEIGKITSKFKEVYRHPKVGIATDSPNQKSSWPYAQQFNSFAQYDGYSLLNNNLVLEDRRRINTSQWLLPIKQLVKDNKRLNNNMRETSYYVEVEKDIPNTINEDTSRFTRGDIGCQDNSQPCQTIIIGGKVKEIQAVSYYTGIKLKQPNQYGQLKSNIYLPIEACHKILPSVPDENLLITQSDFFGGDIYISRHSMFKKMPLFEEWLYDVPFDTEINYRENRNVNYPVYWYDNLSNAIDKFRLSCWDPNAGEDNADLGYFYIWVTGNAYFWCESEFIGNYREFDTTPNSRFYPKTDFNEIAKADNISLQPTFLYDNSLLKTTIENKVLSGYTKSDAPFTVIYSLKNDLQSAGDNWKKFLPLNYTILPQVYGDFTGMHYIDQYSVFFAFENMILYSQEDYSFQTSQGNTVFLGQGDIFTRRLRKLSNDKTGYTGSVDPFSFINTRYGTFFFDRYRHKFFQWTGQLKELQGINSWLERFTQITDPGYKNSMVCVFDNFTNNIYFTDKVSGWTISYKPSVEGFISFHSFVPDWYLTMPDNYASIQGNLWKHNKKYEYLRYYGTPAVFEVGFIEQQQADVELQSLSIDAEFFKVLDYGNTVHNKNRFFDEVLVYNHQGSTGLLKAYVKNKEDRNQSVAQNKDNVNYTEVSQVRGITYNINKLENNHESQDKPIVSWNNNGMTYNVLNTVSKNPRVRESITGQWFKVHLRSYNNFDKILLHLNQPTVDQIING